MSITRFTREGDRYYIYHGTAGRGVAALSAKIDEQKWILHACSVDPTVSIYP